MIDLESSLRFFSFSCMPTRENLKHKYRDLIKLYHPDLHPRDTFKSTQMMQRLNQAYETILAGLDPIPAGSPDVPDELLLRTARDGDNALRDAVIVRCLSRMRNNTLGRLFCARVKEARDNLQDHAGALPESVTFYITLFSQFLRVVETSQLLPLPFTWNSTRFYKNLSLANGFLDLGIRSFYRYEGRGSGNLRNIPLSYLDDADKAFCFLRAYVRDAPHRRMIRDRSELIALYRTRLAYEDRLTV